MVEIYGCAFGNFLSCYWHCRYYCLIMNKDLIETRLRNLDLQIPINILKKLLGCLNNTYRESFLK